MKTSSIVAKMKDNSGKIELEIGAQVTKITEIESTITRNQASLIEFKMKITTLNERRKEIKYTIEIKVLEAKEAESAVLEAIKTVTDVELLSRKRWIASTSVSDYKKCSKFMAEYKMIFEKQGAVIAAELNDHARRIEVAQGAMTSLKEK
jgi:beta-phosphoglucomutase-like phosphatase (HAD superfamily)